jgi:phosphoserine phosphatase
MVSLVAALRVAGVELWTVSSTNKWVVAAGVSDFGIPEERVLAAEVRVDKGLITSDIVAIPTGKGKSTALAQAGLAHPDAVFGNSIHDLAMLEIARNPYPVNPSPALLEKAAKNGWGYFLPLLAEGTQAAVAGE